jgi:glyoxylase-like metal-dependent hydrolase (beta-lactamase superfamily II)
MAYSKISPQVHGIFDPVNWTVTYVVFEKPGSACAIIDSVLDYDPKSGRTSHQSADKAIEFVKNNHLKVEWILETHAHADHLFKDGETITLGDLIGHSLFVPGHTPACVAYQFGDAVFVGDTMFMPDVGTARCDFPGGDAKTLYASVKKILSLAPATRLFMCHDYPPSDRPVAFESTVAEQKAKNIHVHDGISEAAFVDMRTQRDATLEMPVLILPAVQINIRAGELPPKEDNGIAYAKIPLNAL